MTIRNTSMKHGWFYHYRLNDHKIDFLCCNGFESLRTYLDQVFTNCPDHYFESGPRGSSLKFKLGIKPIVSDIEEIELAVESVIKGTIINHIEKLH